MTQVASRKTISIRELNLLDLVMTGEASRLAGCDPRTFIVWAEKLKIKPAATLAGNKLVYKREDVERIVRAYKAFKEGKDK